MKIGFGLFFNGIRKVERKSNENQANNNKEKDMNHGLHKFSNATKKISESKKGRTFEDLLEDAKYRPGIYSIESVRGNKRGF